MKLSALTGGAHASDPEIAGLAADSREVKPGYLFAALAGAKDDGAGYISAAIAAGASAILAAPGAAPKPCAAVLIEDAEPRRRLAELAARFYPLTPEFVAGVTGTNGKSSTVRFAAQLWVMLGRRGASLGTIGAEAPGFSRKLTHTTPEAIALHETIDALARAGADRLAMEVSSHALALHRADGVRFHAAAFTNLTQDHLDFHGDLDAYFDAKKRLFAELLRADGTAVVNADGNGAGDIAALARARGLRLVTTGAKGETLRLDAPSPTADGFCFTLVHAGRKAQINLPLVGAFQAENALTAAGLVLASGAEASDIAPLLARLEGAPGRMQLAGEAGGGRIYVDYAHTPDAIATVLRAVRPHAARRVIAVIGAGGDRDRGKRPLMGRAAEAHADVVIVTDDNPRSEEPSSIRSEVLAGVPGAIEIGDRAEAIARGVAMLGEGDALVIAGKGHETGQVVGDAVHPFNDVEIARAAAQARGGGRR